MKRKLLTLALAALTIGLLGSCTKADSTIFVTGVTLDNAELTIIVGAPDVKLTATVNPANATDKTVSWSSDKTDIATVDQRGYVHAVSAGTANITVITTDGRKTATCTVTVKAAKVPVTGVTLDNTELTITIGDPDVQLTATVNPENATDKTVNWSSDKTDIATVDQQGNVHAVSAGTANITATTTDGGKTATCTMTVTKPALPAGALKGEFSVSATKKVYFSQGNLWYGKVGSATTATWNFETNQYDVQNNWSAEHVSLFFWSKSADEACMETYSGSDLTTTAVFFTNAEAETAKTDFTVNGRAGVWRTLSSAEWQYLLNTRIVNGGKGKGKSYSLNITYGGKMGVVLYPDNYSSSELSGTVDTLPEDVVFLPAAGFRYDSEFVNIGVSGTYCSSSAQSVIGAYFMSFNSSNVRVTDFYRGSGYSVRLITESK